MKIRIIVTAILLTTSVSTPVLAHAESPSDKHPQNSQRESHQRSNESRQKLRNERARMTKELREQRGEFKHHFKSQKEQIAERKREIKDRIASIRTKQSSKLSDKRLQKCQVRQEKINTYIRTSSDLSRDKLTKVQSVEETIRQFYQKQSVKSTEYDAASLLVDEKEASAIAAIEMVESTKFNCNKVGSKNPSEEIKLLHAARTAALAEYRDNLKQLIKIIKNTLNTKQTKVSTNE